MLSEEDKAIKAAKNKAWREANKDKIRAYKNSANKVWNISRFVLSSIEDNELIKDYSFYESENILFKSKMS